MTAWYDSEPRELLEHAGWVRRLAAELVGEQAALLLRKRGSRREGGATVARGERLPGPRELVERAETQRRVAVMVLDLAEPYRSTLLLRFYEDLQPVEIARRRGVPRATVRAHLQRALARLRVRLTAEHGGDQRAWVVALLPLVHSRAWTARRTSPG